MNEAQRHAVAILLAGGRGTRLHGRYPDLPKPMIPVAGRPFIDWIVGYFAGQGIGRFVVSLGHLAEVAEAHFRDRPTDLAKVSLVYERSPQGTGGGLRLAWEDVPGSDVIVANGDSLLLADLAPAWERFERPDVDAIILGVEQEDASRYGSLVCDAQGRLVAFQEKRPGAGVVNAGIYLLKAPLQAMIPTSAPLSIETELLPTWLAEGVRIAVHGCRAPFIDIGTPESLDLAERFVRTYLSPEGRS